MGRSAFYEWFRQQYGPAPKKSLARARDEWLAARYRLEQAERTLAAVRLYESRRDAALNAWCAAKPPARPAGDKEGV